MGFSSRFIYWGIRITHILTIGKLKSFIQMHRQLSGIIWDDLGHQTSMGLAGITKQLGVIHAPVTVVAGGRRIPVSV